MACPGVPPPGSGRCPCGTRRPVRSPHWEAFPVEVAAYLHAAARTAQVPGGWVTVEFAHDTRDVDGWWIAATVSAHRDVVGYLPPTALTVDHRGHPAPPDAATRLEDAGWWLPVDLNPRRIVAEQDWLWNAFGSDPRASASTLVTGFLTLYPPPTVPLRDWWAYGYRLDRDGDRSRCIPLIPLHPDCGLGTGRDW